MKKEFIIASAAVLLSMPVSAQGAAEIYTTSKKGGERMAKTILHSSREATQPLETEYSVVVDPLHKFQTFIGMGGAITDAAAATLEKLPADKRSEVMNAYYGEKGIGYTVARLPIASCDFGTDIYSYIEENDRDLSTFSIDVDRSKRFDMIREAMRLAGTDGKLIAAPWTPPFWMKSNGIMDHGGKLLPEYYMEWANYYVRFCEAYKAEGLPIFALSTQNEPMAVQTWESCIYTAGEERDFVRDYLGPAMALNAHDTKLIIWDHNRDLMYHRASTILNDPEAAKYVWAIGYHWYETWTGSQMNHENMYRTHEAFPDKELVFTEGCVEKFRKSGMKDWALGERYGYSIIRDFNCGMSMWTDWNLLLDEKGGPNHVGNFCFAPIHADTGKGTLIYTNSYYYIGHFCRFIKPGARRIAAAASRGEMLVTAAENSDGSIAVVVMNPTKKEIAYQLIVGETAFDLIIPANGIETVVLR